MTKPPGRVIQTTVNGEAVTALVPERKLLCDFLREDLALTGTHVGCEHGVCGACTIHVDGRAVRSCLMLAVQADGRAITTVEGIAAPDGSLHPVQRAFHEQHALQCGFCTPGFIMTTVAYLDELGADAGSLKEEEIRHALSGTLCRCTGYTNIVRAVLQAAAELGDAGTGGSAA